jgi:predicted NBD/HSP70 family sugar kinase
MISPEQASEIEAELLRLVRLQPGRSRVELARLAGMSPSTTGDYIEKLLARGFLQEGERHMLTPRGRPATQLQLAPEAGYIIGLDAAYHYTRGVALGFDGEVLAEKSVWLDLNTPFETFLQVALDVARACAARGRGQLLGIGISHAPPGDWARKTPHIQRWDDARAAAFFEGEMGVRPSIAFSHHAIGTAELWFGAGREVASFLSLEVRGTVGAELVIDGRMLTNRHPDAGQIGNWLLPDDLLPVSLRKAAPTLLAVNQLASVPGLLGLCTQVLPSFTDSELILENGELPFRSLVHGFSHGDKLSVAALAGAAAAMGWCAARITDLAAPERIIISHPFNSLGEGFIKQVQDTLLAHASLRQKPFPQVTASALADYIGAMGAAAVALHHWRPQRRKTTRAGSAKPSAKKKNPRR